MHKLFYRWKVQRKKAVFVSRVSVTIPRATVESGNVIRTVSPRCKCMSDKAFLVDFWAFFDFDLDFDVLHGVSKMS